MNCAPHCRRNYWRTRPRRNARDGYRNILSGQSTAQGKRFQSAIMPNYRLPWIHAIQHDVLGKTVTNCIGLRWPVVNAD